MMLRVLFLIELGFVVCVWSNNFPSLLNTNATLAIIIDKEFLSDNYDFVKATLESYITHLKRDVIKNGGINVVYYYWTNISIRKEISAIITITSCSDTWKLFKLAEVENILHMAISETDCPRLPRDQGFTIPSIVRGEELPQILIDLRSVKAYNWKSVIVIYDDSLGRDLVTRVLTSLTIDTKNLVVGGAAVSLIKLEDRNETLNINSIKATLSRISSKRSGTNFLVIVSSEIVTYVMQAALMLGLVDINNQWLYVVSNNKIDNESATEILSNLKEGNNIAFLYNISTSGEMCKEGIECHIKEMLDAFSNALNTAIIEEFELANQVSDEEWEAIRPTKTERRNYLLNNMKIFLAKNGICGNCTTWQMKACDTWGVEYSISADREFVLTQVGFWRLADGPSMTDVLFPHVVHGFRGKSFALVSLHNPPWQIIETNSSGIVSCRGLVFDIINELAKFLNFTYTVIVIDDGGYKLENSSFFANDISYGVTYTIPDQVITMIRNKQVFMAAYAYTITERSKSMVNFTIPISTQSYSLLAARPRELSKILLFMSPFRYSTWLCLLSAILIMGPILHYIYKLSPVNEYNGISTRGGLSSIYNCIWYIYGALLQQGGMYIPYADSARLVIGSWWIVVLILSTTYCGNLVAFLTFPNNDKPIRTIDELINQKDVFTWSIAPATFFENEIKASNDPKYQILYHGSVKSVTNVDEMIRSIELGKHVHIDWKLKLQYMMKKNFLLKDSCDLSLGFEDFFEERLALVVAHDNPYLQRINRQIKRLHQVGLIEKWLRDYSPKRDRCYKSKRSSNANNHTVNLNDMQGCFILLFLGFGISSSIICCERFYNKYRKKRERNVVQPFTT